MHLDPIQDRMQGVGSGGWGGLLNQHNSGLSCDLNCVFYTGVKLPRGHDWLLLWWNRLELEVTADCFIWIPQQKLCSSMSSELERTAFKCEQSRSMQYSAWRNRDLFRLKNVCKNIVAWKNGHLSCNEHENWPILKGVISISQCYYIFSVEKSIISSNSSIMDLFPPIIPFLFLVPLVVLCS